ncbi:MAG: iron-containing alcohol dehydrogenase [Streptosporangiaceae bacterium]|nr:iron-containing alcohol dehydrogenase [Streptosporangiaceae bacterium]MBV9855572.1 iron-containing alcohol dehydrogenase [Streptosporangiaceae bacterium]
MLSGLAAFDIPRGPAAHFGAGSIARLPAVIRETGANAVLVVTDAGLAATPVADTVTAALAAAGIPASVFPGVHPNPTTDDLAAGATAAAAAGRGGRIALVALGGGSPIDAAKGIALAAVNPQRGRDLGYSGDFAAPALPIVAIPTTAGTGAETNAFGVVTDPAARRKFYVGHASSLPAAVILDPALTVGLPPAVTAATGMDALTHALESYLSARPNPWSDGIALQAMRMVAGHLPRACADGRDLEARSQMLLAAHMAGLAMAGTGLGLCHAIAHALGGRWNIAHGVALTMVLPDVLRFSLPSRAGRLASAAFALGAGDTGAGTERNAAAAIEAIAALRETVGLTQRIGDFGVTTADFAQIAADALDDEVLANTPRVPSESDIAGILSASSRAPA